MNAHFKRAYFFFVVCFVSRIYGLTIDDLAVDFADTWTVLQYMVQSSAHQIASPTTIDTSGRYKLIKDISGQITIAADSVELDLNTFAVMGGTDCLRIDQQKGVTVKNGILAAGSQSCAKVTNAQEIFFDGVSFVGSYTGLFIQTATGCIVNHCTFDSQSSSMLVLDDVHRAALQASHYRFEGGETGFSELTDVITLTRCSNMLLEGVDVVNNRSSTAGLTPIVHAQDIQGSIIRNCTITGNRMPYFIALLFDQCSDILCQANIIGANTSENSDFGVIYAQASNNVVINKCIINRNISIEGRSCGIQIEDSIDSMVNECHVYSNFSETSTALGILVDQDSDYTTVRDNYVKRNNGLSDGFGIVNNNTNSLIVHNESQGHTTANFLGNIKQISTYSSSLSKFTAITDPFSSYDNISIVP
jgi:hypothetical protein